MCVKSLMLWAQCNSIVPSEYYNLIALCNLYCCHDIYFYFSLLFTVMYYANSSSRRFLLCAQ
jgi:hypothetical protein